MNQVSARERAADWVVRINDPEVTEGELAQWEAWLAEDPLHCDLYQRLDHVWSRSAELTPASDSRERFPWKIAASVLVLVSGGIAAGLVLQSRPEVIETATAEQRSLRLDDGSRVEIAAGSSLAMRLDDSLRSVHLRAGEAYFEIAPDAARPFVVELDEYRLHVLGTAFNIDRKPGRTVVSVTDGMVQLSGPAGETMNLRGGEQAQVDSAGMRRLIPAANPRAAIAWREGRFEYLEEELRYVIEDVNRYSRRKIVLDDARLARQQFTGTVFLDHVDEWLVTLQGSFPVKIVERGDESVLTRR